MFPRGHAVAYVMMAFRIAYFKVHYPEAFYAVYFTVRADAFDVEVASGGPEALLRTIHELEKMPRTRMRPSASAIRNSSRFWRSFMR